MTQYSMNPINNGTRLRKDHNTFSAVITSYNRGQLVVGNELWEAPADGSEVKRGDKWVKVVSVDGVNVTEVGWMAYIHKGVAVCNNFKVIGDSEVPPVVDPQFPSSFVLVNPATGEKVRYDRVVV